MLHKVRALYAQDDSEALSGEVECDEVYIGSKEKWKHRSMRTPNTQGRSTQTKRLCLVWLNALRLKLQRVKLSLCPTSVLWLLRKQTEQR